MKKTPNIALWLTGRPCSGKSTIAAFVSPTNELRKLVSGIIVRSKLCYVRCSPEICEDRDVKGMYKKARLGKIKQFTGVSAPFEEPLRPDIIVDTEKNSLEDCILQIFHELKLDK